MPKATLTFDLNDPDDQRSHLECTKAPEIIMVIYDFDQWLREKLKYAELTTEQDKIYDEVRTKLHGEINGRDLSNLIFE